MTNLRQAAQQALEALDRVMSHGSAVQEAKDILRAALAEPEQEPVAWRYRGNLHEFDPSDWAEGPVTPLYTAPTPRKPLTDEEIEALWQNTSPYYDPQDFARAIERAHGIGEQDEP